MVTESLERKKYSIIEIGARDNNYLKSYKIELPKDTEYRSINIVWDVLPGDEEKGNPINLPDNSVNEVVISNVLSDLVHIDTTNLERYHNLVYSYMDMNGGKFNLDGLYNYVANFQKMRTIKDILRVLKSGGTLRIYENFRQYHPEVVSQIIEWLRSDPNLDFTEDEFEELRIKPILDKKNKETREFYLKNDPHKKEEDIFIPRPNNKVYIIVKKGLG